MKRLMTLLALCALGGPAAMAQTAGDAALLEAIRTGQLGQSEDTRRQLAAFASASEARQRQLLADARDRRDALQRTSDALEVTAREKQALYEDRIRQLRAELGPDAALFGILQQLASELIGLVRNSPTSLELPDREAWLASFVERMEKASEIFTIADLEQLWFLIQQEIHASGQIVRSNAEVLAESGVRETRAVVRVGKFALVSDEPEPAYLAWQADTQRVSVLKRQPAGPALRRVDAYMANREGVAALGIDPTGGSLLTRLVDAPSLRDRVNQGGLIGYLILALGAVGVLIAIYKLVSILIVSARVAAQRRQLDEPRPGNPLGRMLAIYAPHQDVDTETLEMRLGEAILAERPRIDRFVGLLKVIATVAPLMGLMGTVIGMIATFQAITLFGTGDPKTMAGGISQALVTTVLGLTVAIPTVLLHAMVSARANAVINTLKHQTAGLIAERMEARAAGQQRG